MQGHINSMQADAGVSFANFCAKFDHYTGNPRRECASPDYERGYRNSRNDEEALAIRNGTIDDHQRRVKWVQRRWSRIREYFGDEKVFALLLHVCVHDQMCPSLSIPILTAALELLVMKLGLDKIRPEDQPRMINKKRYRKKAR
jgi:hypothetical protein